MDRMENIAEWLGSVQNIIKDNEYFAKLYIDSNNGLMLTICRDYEIYLGRMEDDINSFLDFMKSLINSHKYLANDYIIGKMNIEDDLNDLYLKLSNIERMLSLLIGDIYDAYYKIDPDNEAYNIDGVDGKLLKW